MSTPRLRSAQVLWLAALSASAAVGCFPKGEGERLRRASDLHEERLTSLETGMERERTQMQEALANAQTKVAELEVVLERATNVVTRNSADLGTDVIALREQLQAMEGTVAELQNELTNTQRQIGEQQQEFDQRIQQFARKSGVDMPVDPSQIPPRADDHFSAAYRAFQAGDHSQARALFRAFVERHADDDNVDNAQYWIGKTYLEEGRPAGALGEFRRVLSSWPQGDAIDETLFDMGDAFFQLHACTDARAALEALVSGHPRSPLVAEARSKIREIRRAPRSACTS